MYRTTYPKNVPNPNPNPNPKRLFWVKWKKKLRETG